MLEGTVYNDGTADHEVQHYHIFYISAYNLLVYVSDLIVLRLLQKGEKAEVRIAVYPGKEGGEIGRAILSILSPLDFPMKILLDS